MYSFAQLVDKLYFINSNNAKAELLIDYLHNASRTDRGWAVAAIAGTLSFEFFKRKLIKDLIV
ncbi:MAG: ATP-dependent DNA ligase, partial [Glaciecola sp.]